MICWSCERAAGDGGTCTFCGAIQPPNPAADHFAVLGVPAQFPLDVAEAETRFRAQSRALHPDRFAQADARARRISLARTVQLNEAWRIIKDPVRRAEYLLSRAGYEVGAEAGASRPGRSTGDKAALPGTPTRERIPVPAALLGEILELREELGDARAAGDDGRVQRMAADMRARIAAALARVADGFARARPAGPGADAGRAATPDPALEAVAEDLIAIRYFRRFLEEVAAHDEAVATAAESSGEGAGHA